MHALLIDIGNTSLKIGVAGIEGLVASYTLPTDTQQSGDGLGLQLAYLLCHAGFGTPGTGPGNVALDGMRDQFGRPRHEPAGGPCLRTFP